MHQNPIEQQPNNLLPEQAGPMPIQLGTTESLPLNAAKPAGTVYGQARELSAAEKTYMKEVMPITGQAIGEVAIGRYSVGPVQSEAAQARIAEHESWMNSAALLAAREQVRTTQLAIDTMAQHAANQLDADDDGSNMSKAKRKKRKQFSLAA